MAEVPPPEDAIRAEQQLSASWSIASLRPWLRMIAERELPASLRGRVGAFDVVPQTLLDA